jgi:hypothetical protein
VFYTEAPEQSYTSYRPNVFLAGGITGCSNWQKEIAADLCPDTKRSLHDQCCTSTGNHAWPGTLFNPRRENFPMHDPKAAEAQIRWEHERLWKSDIIAIWFCKETLCPICLFELGSHLTRLKLALHPLHFNGGDFQPRLTIAYPPPPVLIIGIEPGYAREADVAIQTRLVDENIPIVHSLADLSARLSMTAKLWKETHKV